MNENNRNSNRLIHETSPYLLQHAYNPVDWYSWSDEAFENAKKENKPVLLSCGYSACHWCHVMERESFEDPDISALMNKFFINVKVDREERPDIDQLYQYAVQMITGQGGWPLTVFLDHERKPFYGGTYYPPVPLYGRASFPQVLKAISKKWHNERDDITKATVEIVSTIHSIMENDSYSSLPQKDLPIVAAGQLNNAIDQKNGGFGQAPKFPNPVLLQLFLKVGAIHNQPILIDGVLYALKKMARGGLYDQLGGGFHRYSTDQYWLVPHFEKMLYDNALLLRCYAIGYQLTKLEEFKTVITETANYIRREMTAAEGGFYATQDADSEGVEGKYFVWDFNEVKKVLDADDAQLIIDYYHVSSKGNFEGLNILNRLQEPDTNEQQLHPELMVKLQKAKEKLFIEREKRVKPFRDEKIITSWNGLMIGALAYTYQVFQRKEDYHSAKRAAEFILNSVRLTNGGLGRVYKDGQVNIEGMLDDYSFLVQGLINLYEADFNEIWLQKSIELTEIACKTFAGSDGQYYLISDSNDLIMRPLSGQDQAIPSGISVHCENLLRLSSFTGNQDFYREAERILMAYSNQMEQDNWSYAGLISDLDMYYNGLKEFAFISAGVEPPDILIKLRQCYSPYSIIAWRNSSHKNFASHPAGKLFQNRDAIQGKPTCYACFQNSCLAPVTSWDELNTICNQWSF